MFEVQKLYNLSTVDGGLDAFRNALALIGVDCRDYPEHQMMLLDYNMIECIKDHPVVCESRGLIMAYDGSIVCKPFSRFFNLGENGVDTFDFENSVVAEKVDGSLVKIYWCSQTNQWEIGTRGTAFAEGPNEWYGTFRAGILAAIGRTEEQFQKDCERMDKNVTRLYEWISPNNRIVTKYDKSELVILAYVDNITGNEIVAPGCAYEKNLGWSVRPLNLFKFNTQEQCMQVLHELTGLQEGFVAFNTVTKHRIKIKSPVYLAAHRLRGNGLTLNSVCELVVMGEVEEYTSVFPEDTHKFDEAILKLHVMMDKISSTYDLYKHLELQKDFAIAVKDLELSCVYFTARKLQCSAVHAFNSYPVTKRAEWVKERLIKE